MKTAVWDTYVKKQNGETMHFDLIVPEEMTDQQTIFGYAKDYLKSKNQPYENFGAEQSSFCHIESAKPSVQDEIKKKWYYIVEMEGCD